VFFLIAFCLVARTESTEISADDGSDHLNVKGGLKRPAIFCSSLHFVVDKVAKIGSQNRESRGASFTPKSMKRREILTNKTTENTESTNVIYLPTAGGPPAHRRDEPMKTTEITSDQMREWGQLLYYEAADDVELWLDEFGQPPYLLRHDEATGDALNEYFEQACERAGLTPYLDPAYGVRASLEEDYFEALDEHTEHEFYVGRDEDDE
jgi:hypothetical protein